MSNRRPSNTVPASAWRRGGASTRMSMTSRCVCRQRLRAPQRIRSGGEYGRDEDGDGFHEAHVDTTESVWSLLRSWLRLD
jgi:hypothetical protein